MCEVAYGAWEHTLASPKRPRKTELASLIDEYLNWLEKNPEADAEEHKLRQNRLTPVVDLREEVHQMVVESIVTTANCIQKFS